MKKALSYFAPPVIAALVMLLALSSQASGADSGTCYTIDDADARAYCLAKAHKDPGRCYAIESKELRSICLAEVRK